MVLTGLLFFFCPCRMSIRVHAPYLVPGWEICRPSTNPKMGTALDGAILQQGYRRKIYADWILLPKFTFKDTIKVILHANGKDGNNHLFFLFFRFYNVFFFLACGLRSSAAFIMLYHNTNTDTESWGNAVLW